MFSTSSQTTYADGHQPQTGGKCATWLLPPDAQFGANGVCTYADAAGPLYAVQYTCEVQVKDVGANCWGKLLGQGGAWKGRTGTVAFFSKTDGTNVGSGQWN